MTACLCCRSGASHQISEEHRGRLCCADRILGRAFIKVNVSPFVTKKCDHGSDLLNQTHCLILFRVSGRISGGHVPTNFIQSSTTYIWISKTERCFSLCVNSLNDEAKMLIADLGSFAVNSLGYRDNWLFVGGKRATMRNFEKVTTTTSWRTHNTHQLI